MPPAMTAVHIAFTYTALQTPSYFLLIEAAYQLLFSTQHKSRGLKDFKKKFLRVQEGGGIKWGFLGGADRMKRSWGPIEMLRKWPSFFFPPPSRSGVGSSQLRHFINSCYLTSGIVVLLLRPPSHWNQQQCHQ